MACIFTYGHIILNSCVHHRDEGGKGNSALLFRHTQYAIITISQHQLLRQLLRMLLDLCQPIPNTAAARS